MAKKDSSVTLEIMETSFIPAPAAPLRLYFDDGLIELQVLDDSLKKAIEFDFSYFLSTAPSARLLAHIEIDIGKTPSTFKKASGLPLSHCYIKGWGMTRSVFYKNGSTLSHVEALGLRKVKITAASFEHGRELSNLLINSIFGEYMERRGWMRLHGLAYVENSQQAEAQLFTAPSGLGKSTASSYILSQTSHELLSDEIIWLKGQWVKAYPLRIALHPQNETAQKWLDAFPLQEGPEFKRLNTPAKRTFSVPSQRIQTSSKWRKIIAVSSTRSQRGPLRSRLFWALDVVAGYGLPQMTEIFLRGPNLLFLSKLFFKRLGFAAQCLLFGRVSFAQVEFGISELISRSNHSQEAGQKFA